MTGLQEILLLLLVLMVIVLLSRLSAGRQTYQAPAELSFRRLNIPAARRLAIVISLFWPLGLAVWLKPWQADPIGFVLLGIGPVAAAWAGWWIIKGYRR